MCKDVKCIRKAVASVWWLFFSMCSMKTVSQSAAQGRYGQLLDSQGRDSIQFHNLIRSDVTLNIVLHICVSLCLIGTQIAFLTYVFWRRDVAQKCWMQSKAHKGLIMKLKCSLKWCFWGWRKLGKRNHFHIYLISAVFVKWIVCRTQRVTQNSFAEGEVLFTSMPTKKIPKSCSDLRLEKELVEQC